MRGSMNRLFLIRVLRCSRIVLGSLACALAVMVGAGLAAEETPVPAARPAGPLVIQVPQQPAVSAPEPQPPFATPPGEIPPAPAPVEETYTPPQEPLPAAAPSQPHPVEEGPAVDLSAQASVIDAEGALVPGAAETVLPGAAWFTLRVENRTDVPVARIFIAADPPAAGIAGAPYLTRPALREAAASDSAVLIQEAVAFGRGAFRVLLPPAYRATLALHFEGIGDRPQLLAWTESALIAHNRRASILSGLVTGLFAGALVFSAGMAVFGSRPFARWAAMFIAALLLSHLSASGLFDGSWLTVTGGPYAVFSLTLALAIAAAIRLIDHVASYEAFKPWARLWADRIAIIIVVLGLASFFGVPWIGLFLRVLAVIAAAAAAGYVAYCGRFGVAAARRLAPAATIFALVTAVAALRATGLFGSNLVARDAIAGFSAAAALLVAMASAVASSEPSVARLRVMRDALREDDSEAERTDEAVETLEHAAVGASHQGIFDLELESGVLSVSAQGAAILGFPPGVQDLSRDAWVQRIHPEDREIYLQAMETYRRQPDLAFRLEFRARGPSGRTAWYELRATMIGQATEAERCLGLVADVTARKTAETAASSVRSDALTGLGNRLSLFERLESLKTQTPQMALLVVDLDRFKSVNSSLGADAGDAMLKSAAERLAKKFERSSVYRVGGDMFAVIARRPTDLQTLGTALLQTMAPPFSFSGREIFLPVSVGVAAGDATTDPQDLMTQAELAMVQAKRNGGARACVYSPALSASGKDDSVALDTDLRRAIERGEIALYYQPIVRLSDSRVAGFEALLRWSHPQRGTVQPEEFIPHAERTGLIVPLGLFALRESIKDLAEWQRSVSVEPPLFVSVNVTSRQLADQKFMQELEALLQRAKLPEHALCVEVTESTVVADSAAGEATLARLRTLGVSLAIDDFGTGQSSLSHLQRFPVDAVKLDKSFAPADEKDGAAILASMIALAHELEMKVVAEGVETVAHAERLRRLNCDYGQGFLFAAPMPAGDVQRYLQRMG